MMNTLFSPLEAIEAQKKERNLGKTYTMLVFASIMAGLAAFFYTIKTGGTFGSAIGILVLLAIAVFLSNMFNAWVYKFTIKTLSGKGTYYDSLTALTNAAGIISIGLLVASLLYLIPYSGIVITMLITIILLLVIFLTVVSAYAVLIKTLTTLSGADLLSVVVGLGVVIMASIVTMYVAIALLMMMVGPLMGGLANPYGLGMESALM